MNLATLHRMAKKFEFAEILDALENLSCGEMNLKDKFLNEADTETLSGLIYAIAEKYSRGWGRDVISKIKEDELLKSVVIYAAKKADKNIAVVAEGWRNLDSIDFINYLVGFIDTSNSLKKNVAFCEMVIKSLSDDTAKSWLRTLERLDGCCLKEEQYLVCYLLRARLQIDRHIYTIYNKPQYFGD